MNENGAWNEVDPRGMTIYILCCIYTELAK